jgi:hypothetical protein
VHTRGSRGGTQESLRRHNLGTLLGTPAPFRTPEPGETHRQDGPNTGREAGWVTSSPRWTPVREESPARVRASAGRPSLVSGRVGHVQAVAADVAVRQVTEALARARWGRRRPGAAAASPTPPRRRWPTSWPRSPARCLADPGPPAGTRRRGGVVPGRRPLSRGCGAVPARTSAGPTRRSGDLVWRAPACMASVHVGNDADLGGAGRITAVGGPLRGVESTSCSSRARSASRFRADPVDGALLRGAAARPARSGT